MVHTAGHLARRGPRVLALAYWKPLRLNSAWGVVMGRAHVVPVTWSLPSRGGMATLCLTSPGDPKPAILVRTSRQRAGVVNAW